MLTYLLISLIWTSSIQSSPIQTPNLKTSPFLLYRQPSSQYVPQNLFLQYPIPSTFGKALQGVPSPNEILFYPNSGQVTQQAQQVLVNPQLVSNISPASKFTAPPSGLVNAIYAWFAENNIPAPDDPTKNDATQERIEIAKDQGKIENPDKPPSAGEADILAEADKNPNFLFPKKPTSKYNPGRFYILNGQPQFFGNYQPVLPRLQPVIPQLFTRNTVPSDPQNILILQPQSDLQQPNLKNPAVRHQEQEAQNVVLLRNNLGGEQISNIQPEIMKPVRYHSQDLKPQNFVLLRETPQNEQQLQVQPLVQTYSRQQLLIGRLLPQSHEIKEQQVQNSPVHQTHYVPVEVVPPQVPVQQSAHLQYHHNEQIPQQDVNQQQLSFIHIPVDRNVQPPQYIKSLIPIQLNGKSQIQGIPTTHPLQNQQQHNQQILYLSPEAQQNQLLAQRHGLIQQDQLQQQHQQQQQQQQQQQLQQHHQQEQIQQDQIQHAHIQHQQHHQQEQIQQDQIQHAHIQHVQDLPTTGIEEQIHQQQIVQQPQQQQQQQQQQQEQAIGSNDVPPGVAALEFARYIASRHGDLYSDTVVIDAKSSEEDKAQTGQESEASDETQADVAEEPSLAQAQPSGVALAGTGGVAATAPRGTALVGDKGLAVASPHATAVAGPEKSKKEMKTT